MGKRLAALGYRVWVPDQRGYNLSDEPARVTEYNSDAFSRDLPVTHRRRRLRTVDLIGHDWGGHVAWWTPRATQAASGA
jgi:pimeloyl-ACP methyl ester carboxylesterase